MKILKFQFWNPFQDNLILKKKKISYFDSIQHKFNKIEIFLY
jgi:hypothetical protein